jgi:hypothetical protein
MPEQDARARQVQHPKEVLDVKFPAGDEPTGVMQPGKEALDLPATPTSPKGSAILGARAATVDAVCRDHLDAIALAQQRIEGITVVAAIAD